LSESSVDEVSEFFNIKSNEKVLVYFHSLYGGVNVYHKNTVRKLKELDGFDRIISVIWHTDGWNYLNSYNAASATSELYQPYLETILERRDIELSILCHSMGHRIFEGVVKDYSANEISLNKVIFTGSDLDLESFDNSLRSLPSFTKQLVVYVHENDRLLKQSRKFHKKDRLGLNALQKDFSSIQNLECIDVTNSSGQKLIRLSNHIYFKRDKLVLADINNVLNEQKEIRNAYLKYQSSGIKSLN